MYITHRKKKKGGRTDPGTAFGSLKNVEKDL